MANSRQNPNSARKIWALALLLAGVMLVGGVAAYIKFSGGDRIPEELVRKERTSGKNSSHVAEDSHVTVLTPRYEGSNLRFEKSEAAVPRGHDKMVFAVNEFLSKAKVAPEQARAMSCKLEKGLLTIDFTKAFDTTYGTEDERTLVNGILSVLGQFPEVERVQFSCDGKPVETLGNIDLSLPQPVVREPAK